MKLERVKVRQRTRRGEELVRSGNSLTNVDRKYTVSGCFFLHLTYLSQVLADQSKCDLQYSEENVSWSLFAQHCKVDQLKIVQEARNPLQSFIPVPTQYRYLYSISNQYLRRVKQSFIIKTLPDPSSHLHLHPHHDDQLREEKRQGRGSAWSRSAHSVEYAHARSHLGFVTLQHSYL